jgi:hypothetical protein
MSMSERLGKSRSPRLVRQRSKASSSEESLVAAASILAKSLFKGPGNRDSVVTAFLLLWLRLDSPRNGTDEP